MPWFKVDDNLAFHAKAVAAGNPAMGLWVRAGAWCAQQLTDGFLPDHMLPSLGTKQQANRLVDVRLWERIDGGYRFHEWTERQPRRDDVEAERAAARDRMREFRARKKKTTQDTSPQVDDARSEDVRPNTSRSSGEVRETFGNPDPTRPDPTRPNKKEGARKRATRLPDNFTPTDDHVALAAGLGVNLDHEFAKFCDYWIGEGKPKADWNATLRNWIRRAGEDRGGRPAQPVRQLPNAQDIELPPDGLSDQEYAAWYAAQQHRRRA